MTLRLPQPEAHVTLPQWRHVGLRAAHASATQSPMTDAPSSYAAAAAPFEFNVNIGAVAANDNMAPVMAGAGPVRVLEDAASHAGDLPWLFTEIDANRAEWNAVPGAPQGGGRWCDRDHELWALVAQGLGKARVMGTKGDGFRKRREWRQEWEQSKQARAVVHCTHTCERQQTQNVILYYAQRTCRS